MSLPARLPARIAAACLVFALAAASSPLAAAAAGTDSPCIDEIKALMSGSMAAGPYVMVTDVVSPYGNTSTVSQLLPPRGMHSTSLTGSGTTEIMVLDGKGWMKLTGDWQPMDAAMVAAMRGVFADSAMAGYDTIANARCLGPAAFDGGQALLFTYETFASGTTTTTRLHANIKTRLPIEVISETPSDAGPITVTSLYEYDAVFTLEAPL